MEKLTDLLAARNIPELMKLENGEQVKTCEQMKIRRREILNILSREEYGFTPPAAEAAFTVEKEERGKPYAGKGFERYLTVSFDTPGGLFFFPLYLAIPIEEKPVPCVLLINFDRQIPAKYCPAEEILDHGFAVAYLYYEDITSDDRNMQDKLAGRFSLANRNETGMGKIGCWAYGMSRAVDVLLKQPEIRKDAIITAGHSRLGKTSLWCAAQDERIAGCIVNDSGCGGDAITRGKTGERVKDITDKFPFWFCRNYQKYREREDSMPFDQHFLAAAVAPRPVAAGTAQLDQWADPQSQLFSYLAASPAWRVQGGEGISAPEYRMEPDHQLKSKDVSFHLRTGFHYLSRTDWHYYLSFFGEKFGINK